LSVSQSDIYAIIHQGTKPEQFQANLEAVRYFQDKKFEFSEAICLQFVRNGVNADQVEKVARILTIPVNRIGNHLNEDSFRKVFFNLLAKDLHNTAFVFLRSVYDRGLAERLVEFHHFESLFRAFKKANPEPKSFRPLIRFAKKVLSKADFKQIDEKKLISDNPPTMKPKPVVAEASATKETEATVTQVVPPTTEAAAQPAVAAAAEKLGEANSAPQEQQQPEAQTNVPPKKEETPSS
jgi:hypothetical protein